MLYLFRGHEREWANANEDNSRNGKTVKDVADKLIESGSMGKIILVMPGLSSADNAVPALAVNFANPALVSSNEGIGTGKFEDYLVNDLIPYIDKNFRTIPSRWFRGVEGFSLGGITSLMFATKHPELVSSAGDYDGTLMWLDFDSPYSVGGNDDQYLKNSMFKHLFDFNPAYALPYNQSNNVANASASKLYSIRQIQFLIHSSNVGGSNKDVNTQFLTVLANKRIQNGFASLPLSAAAEHNWFYNDLHASMSFPLHYKKFVDTKNNIGISLKSPLSAQKYSGTVNISWSRQTITDSTITLLSYSKNGGKTWAFLSKLPSADSSFQWNTALIDDGTRYKVRVMNVGDTIFAQTQTQTVFTVNNPGNGAPDVELISPIQGEIIHDTLQFQIEVNDAEGDNLNFGGQISYDNGITWKNCFQGSNIPGQYNFSVSGFSNSTNAQLRIWCSDGTLTTYSAPVTVILSAKRTNLASSIVKHISGNSSVKILVTSDDASKLNGHTYQINVGDSLGRKFYNVVDKSTGKIVVAHATELNGKTEGPAFDHLHLLIADLPVPLINLDSTRWKVGNSTLDVSVITFDIFTGTDTIKATAHPSDYEVRIADAVKDTSLSLFGAPAIPMYFSVWNVTENKKIKILFNDMDGNGKINALDELYFYDSDSTGKLLLTWHLFFSEHGTVLLPNNGDVFKIAVLKPLTKKDVYEFTAIPLSVRQINEYPNGFSLMQNYPNPFNPSTHIEYQIPINGLVTLTVYDVLGRSVATLVNQQQQSGLYKVDFANDGLPTSSGVYFYQLRINGLVITKKMILLK